MSTRTGSAAPFIRPTSASGAPECFVATEVTDPAEYTRLFALAVNVFAGYGDYRAKTVSIGRQIPIFRLKPR